MARRREQERDKGGCGEAQDGLPGIDAEATTGDRT